MNLLYWRSSTTTSVSINWISGTGSITMCFIETSIANETHKVTQFDPAVILVNRHIFRTSGYGRSRVCWSYYNHTTTTTTTTIRLLLLVSVVADVPNVLFCIVWRVDRGDDHRIYAVIYFCRGCFKFKHIPAAGVLVFRKYFLCFVEEHVDCRIIIWEGKRRMDSYGVEMTYSITINLGN